MTNIGESLINVMKNVLDTEPKSPLHIGEVMSLWTYLILLQESNHFVEIGINTTTDDDLLEALNHSWTDCDKQINEIKKLFKTEGISLPNTSEPKPKSEPNSIPSGVKLTDDEIANGLVMKSTNAIAFCGLSLSQALRTDIGIMWYQFFNTKVKFGTYYMPIMRKRGWLKVPPYYVPNGIPTK